MNKRIYIDGIFDLFHRGHLESMKQAKKLYTNVTLIIGIISDKNATNYKRKPIIPENDRYNIVENIKIVDEIIKNAPLIITKEFIKKNKIDIIAHGFLDDEDYNKQLEFFKIPISMSIFKRIKYYSKESTTNIITRIKNLK